MADKVYSKEIVEDEESKAEGTEDDTDAKKWTDSILESLGVGDKKPSAAVAVTPVHRDSYEYNMFHPKRGRAVIFNHMTFTNGQSERKGTDKDEVKLKQCFNSLGFEVAVYRDLQRMKIYQVLEDLQKEDHSKHDCLVVVVLSHGEQDKIFSSDSDYRPEDLWNPFAANLCPTLAGKPKIFLIQACRGDQLDSGTKLARTQTDSRSLSTADQSVYVVPNRADFLVVFSTAPGYYSWRNTQEGSWFVQTLTKVLAEYNAKKDMLAMMTIMTRLVALDFESNVPGSPTFDQKKQVPMVTSTLTREIWFKK